MKTTENNGSIITNNTKKQLDEISNLENYIFNILIPTYINADYEGKCKLDFELDYKKRIYGSFKVC